MGREELLVLVDVSDRCAGLRQRCALRARNGVAFEDAFERLVRRQRQRQHGGTGGFDIGKQLVAGGRPGLIALDLSAPIRSQRGISISTECEDAQLALVERELAGYLKDHLTAAHLKNAMHPNVLGLAFRHRVVGAVGSAHEIRVSRTWQLIPICPVDREHAFVTATEFLGAQLIDGRLDELEQARLEIFGPG